MFIRQTSIIICTYNRAALLPRVISQLITQDYPVNAFEIIVVDNASTDNTRVVIERLASATSVPIKYVLESRPGITFARNRGAEATCYPYLAYLDDDCNVSKNWLSQLMAGFDVDEYVVIVAGHIIVNYDKQQKPKWLGAKSENWLGAFSDPGLQPHLLNNPKYVCEGNMAIARQALEDVGGFLGMDQLGSPHEAAQEILYLLEQVKLKGGKVAFVPDAIANHHTAIPTQTQLLKRAFWNGVSAGILEFLLHPRTWASAAYQVLLNIAATFFFFVLSLFSIITFDEASAMYHLLRAIRRLGLVLSELHLVGDWNRIRSFKAAKPGLSI